MYRTMSNRPRTFTGKGWIRIVIVFNLTTNLVAWKNRCNLLFDTKNDVFGDEIMSSHKKSLIIRVQHYYEKAGDLPYKYKKWFDKPIEKILKSTVKHIQNWIVLTKKLLKANKTYRTEHNKITNYFITEEDTTLSLIHI